uniref:DNA (Cytosine-5)-methyltransferase 1 n=1 Tax=Candidatus Kentrum sp. TC TaxID=2126339 RepID=A0A451AA07_9GAMM|nr:MAG: DNA (cytosine-5)-methyltransferase 1 [Candidatus Kentron sp. TC]
MAFRGTDAGCFIVGFRSDSGQAWSFPKPTHSLDRMLWDQWVNGSYWDEHEVAQKHRPPIPEKHKKRLDEIASDFFLNPPPGDRFGTVRDALLDLPDPVFHDDAFMNHEFQPNARPYPGHTGSSLDEPAKALKAGDHGVPEY